MNAWLLMKLFEDENIMCMLNNSSVGVMEQPSLTADYSYSFPKHYSLDY